MGIYQGWISLRPAWPGLLEGNMPSHCIRLQSDTDHSLCRTQGGKQSCHDLTWFLVVVEISGSRRVLCLHWPLGQSCHCRLMGRKNKSLIFALGRNKSWRSSCKLKMCKCLWAGREGRWASTLASERSVSLQLCTHFCWWWGTDAVLPASISTVASADGARKNDKDF